jgi:hypothetical protein
MYKAIKLGLIAASIIGLAACSDSPVNSNDDSPQGIGEVTYQLTFNAKWNESDFPTGFPSNPHFSPIIGATHNDQDYLWRTGEPATDGIEEVAETGATGTYNSELAQKKTEGNVDNIFIGSRVDSPGATSFRFKVNTVSPYVSAISMIAPSPDWFIGIRDVNLYIGNSWVDKLVFDLKLYDSGTDSGVTFDADNADGGTEIITLVTSFSADTDFNEGVHRSSGKTVGTITLQRVTDGFVNSTEE